MVQITPKAQEQLVSAFKEKNKNQALRIYIAGFG